MKNKINLDPSLEKKNYVLKGCQHKYKETLLILVTNRCFKQCKHCFRQRIFNNNEEVCNDYRAVYDYIKSHPEITNVLISGGDPLTLSNKQLEEIIMKYIPKGIDIRIGTRALTYKPERFDKSLISLLKVYNVSLQLHINLPYEYDLRVVEKLRRKGIVMRSQTVLLKNINDKEVILTLLFRNLARDGIYPYYLFQNRPLLTKYSVPLIKGVKLINKVKSNLSGMEKTFRYIMSNSKGKVEIVGITDKNFVFRFHQAKNPKLINKVFLIPVSNKMIWWDENVKEEAK